jgi:Na+/pantothenate symporter
MDLRELLEARQGRPTEDEAARKIATFAVIPAAISGLLAGTQLVGLADPVGRLLWVCTASALGAGLAIACLVLGVYSLFGFRPVVVLADALVGGFIGLLCGGTLALFLMWLKLVHHDLALWALVLIPLGAVVVPLYRAQSDQPRVHDAEGQATESQTVEKS